MQNELLQELVQEREKLLNKNPELRPMQSEIERRIEVSDDSGQSLDSFLTIQCMLHDIFITEFLPEVKRLQAVIKQK